MTLIFAANTQSFRIIANILFLMFCSLLHLSTLLRLLFTSSLPPTTFFYHFLSFYRTLQFSPISPTYFLNNSGPFLTIQPSHLLVVQCVLLNSLPVRWCACSPCCCCRWIIRSGVWAMSCATCGWLLTSYAARHQFSTWLQSASTGWYIMLAAL